MSMSTHIEGFRPPDEHSRLMKAVWDACEAAGADIPPCVADFFNDEEPAEAGVRIDLRGTPCCASWGEGDAEGVEINLSKVPPDITTIRFYNSW